MKANVLSGRLCQIALIGVFVTGAALAGAFLPPPDSTASELVYEPVNPSFGGNPFNSAHLLGLADRQNDYDGKSRSLPRLTPADQFLRDLERRLLSGLSVSVHDAIFGENAQDSGKVVFGDQEISFERGLEAVHLVIEDLATGSRTEISVPLLQVEP